MNTPWMDKINFGILQGILSDYIKIFEGTFVSVHDLDESADDLQTIGVMSAYPIALAHYVGTALLAERIKFGRPVTLPLKAEGQRMKLLEWEFGIFDPPYSEKRLFWRDRPVWDAFEICMECQNAHPDGIDPWTKEPVKHIWQPRTVYSVYLRYATRLTT